MLLECVPNISEGCNEAIISAIANIISAHEGVQLRNVDSGKSANRTVFTFTGKPQAVVNAAFTMYKYASENLSMINHKGRHPRAGIVDVCPLVPLQNMTMEQAQQYALQLAEKVATELHIPVYLYEQSASQAHRCRLEQIRAGEYEGFAQKILQPEWKPDFGEAVFNEKTGITVIGARKFLIAYNVNLSTQNVEIARKIAQQVRQLRQQGVLPGVKAIGWYIEDFNMVQVSTNITDFEQTSLFTVFTTIKQLTQKFNCEVCGSELIGLIPRAALEQTAAEVEKQGVNSLLACNAIETAIQFLGLNSIKKFNEGLILE